MSGDAKRLYADREKRVQAAIDLKSPDKVPVYCHEDGYAWAYSGVSLIDYMTDNDRMMASLKKFHSDFQTDLTGFLPVLMDPLTLAFLQPCPIKLPGKDLPSDSVHQLVEAETMCLEDYQYAQENGYISMLLKLLPEIRPSIPDVREKFLQKTKTNSELGLSNIKQLQKLGKPLWFSGYVESPISLLVMLRTYAKFCLDLYRNFNIVAPTVETFSKELAELAVQDCKLFRIKRAIIGLHNESASFFSLKQFEELALPEIKTMINILIQEKITPILHCDGNWNLNLPYLTELPKRKCVIELDDSTDIFKAKEILGDRICISGGPMELLLSFGTPKKVKKYCKKLIDVVGEGGGFLLKGEPPPTAKTENVRAMIEAAKNYGVYKD